MALEAWRGNDDQGVIAVVTGGGKTVFAYSCMLDLRSRKDVGAYVIVTPTLALLDQWYVGLTEDLSIPQEQIAVFGTSYRGRHRLVNLAVVNTARRVAPEISRSVPTFLIVDECHRAASHENRRSLQGTHLAALGLSATPERDYDDLFEENVVPVLGPVIYRYGYDQALADRVISPFSLTNVEVPLGDDEREAYDAYTRRLIPLFRRRDRGEDVDLRLTRLLRERARVSIGARLRIPGTLRILQSHRQERAIIFHEQIAAANAIAARLRAEQHRVAVYHSGLGPQLRQDNLRLFRRGEVDVLVTCRALDEGINVPDASLAIIAASTSSTRQRIQRLGRVLRPAKGKATANIYTLYASAPEAERLRREADGLEGVERIRWLALSPV